MEAEGTANAKAEVQVSLLKEHTEGQHDWHIMGKEYEQDEWGEQAWCGVGVGGGHIVKLRADEEQNN